MVPLHRNRDFLVLWSAQLVSTLGSQVSLVAFPLLVLALTGSPAKAGVVGFANTIPALLFYLPAGVLVDRHDRRTVMVAASAIGAVALASLPAALALGQLAFGQIVLVAFVQGTVTAVFSLTEQGALPLVVDRSQVPEALARNDARRESAILAGPPLGGVLFGISRALPFAADAISYLICSLSLLALRTPLQEPRQATERRRRTPHADPRPAARARQQRRAPALRLHGPARRVGRRPARDRGRDDRDAARLQRLAGPDRRRDDERAVDSRRPTRTRVCLTATPPSSPPPVPAIAGRSPPSSSATTRCCSPPAGG